MICTNSEVDIYQASTELVKRDNREFGYVLNNKRTKAKVLKGAKRVNNLEVERKPGCVNFLFCDGSYYEVVLPMLRIWNKKLLEVIKVNDFEIKVIESDEGKDESGNHVDTKLAVIVNSKRLVLHAYNSTQKLMVQGKDYENFSINCLETFFRQKIGEALNKISNFNNDVKVTLGAQKALNKTFKCPQCELTTIKNGELKVHMKTCHTKPSIVSPPKNKVPKIMNEDGDISLLDESVMKGIDMDELLEDERVCEWATCNFRSNDMSIQRKHFDDEHMVYLKKKYLGPKTPNIPEIENCIWCYICGFEAEEQEQFEKHMKSMHPSSSNNVAVPSHPTEEDNDRSLSCTVCGYRTNNKAGLEEHIKDKHITCENFKCTVCDKAFAYSGELEVHVQTNHSDIQNDSLVVEKQEEKVSEVASNIETEHEIQEDCLTLKCGGCDYQTNTENELRAHKQAIHMSLKVNVDLKEQEGIRCSECGYSCKLNIQLKKHISSKHGDKNLEKYNCKNCDFVSTFIADMWKHTLDSHPERTSDLGQQDTENMVMKIVAEQNSVLIEEVNSFRTEIKEAFGILANVIVETFGSIKDDTSEKCKVLVEKLSKIESKVSKFKVKPNTIGRSRVNPRTSKSKSKAAKASFDASVPLVSSSPGPEQTQLSPSGAGWPPSAPPRPTYASVTRPKATSKSEFNLRPKVLFVADSVGHRTSIREVEKASKTRIRTAHAYSSVRDTRARWPEVNFKDSVEKELRNPGIENFDFLVMTAPTVDISNLDTRKIEQKENLQKCAQISSRNMFKLAEDSLAKNPSLKKVIIMEHTPRFDTPEADPRSLKPALARLANATLRNLWLSSPYKERIVIGLHSLESSGGGDTHYARYRNPVTGRYDGVHLYGATGCRDYTNSVKSILLLALSDNPVQAQEVGDHKRCPQALHQNRRKTVTSVPTQNRFSIFNTHLGNF